MTFFTPTRRLILVGAAALILGGCATQHHQVARTPAPIDEEIAILLERNALAQGNSMIALGAGDRFGHRMHGHFVALVHARELHQQMVAEVTDTTR